MERKKILLMLAAIVLLGTGAYIILTKGKSPANQNYSKQNQENDFDADISKDQNNPSGSSALTAEWKSYSNPKLGISFQYPEKIMNKNSGCDDKDGFVPIKINEDIDKGIVYLSYGCLDTIESLRENTEGTTLDDGTPILNAKPPYGWKIKVLDVKSESEIDTFIKGNYGKGCYVSKKKDWIQKGIYEIALKGEDWDKEGTDPSNTTCSAGNTVYELLQSPNKIIDINLGQDNTFCNYDPETSSSAPECFDEEIKNSLRFN